MSSTRPRNTHIPLNISVAVPQELKETGDLLELSCLSEKARKIVYDFLEAGFGEELASFLRDMTEDYYPRITDNELTVLLEEEGIDYLKELKGN